MIFKAKKHYVYLFIVLNSSFCFSMEYVNKAFNKSCELVMSPAGKIVWGTAAALGGYKLITDLSLAALHPQAFFINNTNYTIEEQNTDSFVHGVPLIIKSSLRTTLKTVPCGLAMAAAARYGSWPKLEYTDLIRPALVNAVCATSFGYLIGYGLYALEETEVGDDDFLRQGKDFCYQTYCIKAQDPLFGFVKGASVAKGFISPLLIALCCIIKRYRQS